MQVLIIGCGYLGRRVARRFHGAGARVLAVTRSPSRADEFRSHGWEPVIADICEPETLDRLPPADLTVFAVGFDRTSGKTQREVYVDGLQHVLERLHGHTSRLISISSSSVYGQQNGEWVDEDSVCEPQQPGGVCCLEAERLVVAAGNKGGLATNVLRLSGIYGPNRLLSRVEALRRAEPLAGSADAWLNLIHVEDAASAVVACAERGTPGRIYLVSDDEPVRRGEYYSYLAELVGAPAPHFDAALAARHGAGGLNKRCRNQRLKAELQVELQFPTHRSGLEQALRDSEDWEF